MSSDVQKTLDAINRDFEEFKTEHTKQLAEVAKGKADVVLAEKVDKINNAISELEAKQAELEKDETISQKLADLEQAVYTVGGESKESDEDARDKKTFLDWMREDNRDTSHAMKEMARKAVTIGTAANGGYAVPAPIASEILQLAIDISPIASAVRVTNVSSPLYERLVNLRGGATGWAGEGTTRAVQDSPTLAQVTFTHGELYTNLQASNWSLTDLMFDVEAWLKGDASDNFAKELGDAVTDGDGSNKPTGFLSGTPVTTADDGARAFQTLQYVFTGAAAAFASSDPGDVFFDVMGEINDKYLPNAAWTMNRSTKTTVRKFKDGDGNYLWEPSFQKGVPDRILDYPVIMNEGMADVGANAFPVAFGDFREGYELINLHGMTAIRDEVTVKGHTLFYLASRFGGNITNDDAIKVIKVATS